MTDNQMASQGYPLYFMEKQADPGLVPHQGDDTLAFNGDRSSILF